MLQQYYIEFILLKTFPDYSYKILLSRNKPLNRIK